jgi:GTPase SAR1 family protein
LGDGAVGKTSIIKRFSSGGFVEEHVATLGLDFVTEKYTSKENISV